MFLSPAAKRRRRSVAVFSPAIIHHQSSLPLLSLPLNSLSPSPSFLLVCSLSLFSFSFHSWSFASEPSFPLFTPLFFTFSLFVWHLFYSSFSPPPFLPTSYSPLPISHFSFSCARLHVFHVSHLCLLFSVSIFFICPSASQLLYGPPPLCF